MRRLWCSVTLALASACSEPRTAADYVALSSDARGRDSAQAALAWADSAVALDSSWSSFEARAQANRALGRTDDARRDFETFVRFSPVPAAAPGLPAPDIGPDFPIAGHGARVQFLFESGDTLAALDALQQLARHDRSLSTRLRTFCSGIRDRETAAGWDRCWRRSSLP